MSFFDDQFDDWLDNDCKGDPSDYYNGEIGPWVDPEEFQARVAAANAPKPRTEAQKARKRRNRARRRMKQAATVKPEGRTN